MKSFLRIVPVFLLASVLTGCASSGAFLSANATDVQLREDNYEIVATNVSGESTAGYLLGVSSGYFGQMFTFAVARVEGEGMLYAEAIADMWDNFEEEHPDMDTESLALVNVGYDTDALNLLLYTKPTVRVRADIVRFVE